MPGPTAAPTPNEQIADITAYSEAETRDDDRESEPLLSSDISPTEARPSPPVPGLLRPIGAPTALGLGAPQHWRSASQPSQPLLPGPPSLDDARREQQLSEVRIVDHAGGNYSTAGAQVTGHTIEAASLTVPPRPERGWREMLAWFAADRRRLILTLSITGTLFVAGLILLLTLPDRNTPAGTPEAQMRQSTKESASRAGSPASPHPTASAEMLTVDMLPLIRGKNRGSRVAIEPSGKTAQPSVPPSEQRPTQKAAPAVHPLNDYGI
jgi:hypothetical protein